MSLLGEPVGQLPPSAPARSEIRGRGLILRRPDPVGDVSDLYSATHGAPEREAVWEYMGYGPWSDEFQMAGWMASTLDSADPFWWVVESEGHPVGMAAVLNVDQIHRRAEIGHIWYVPSVHRTTVNTEAAYLMIRECFETMGSRRVEWKCDALNLRSREAAQRLGFVFEGVFRHHMIVKGRNRDTAWFAMTADDWRGARPMIEAWLSDPKPGGLRGG